MMFTPDEQKPRLKQIHEDFEKSIQEEMSCSKCGSKTFYGLKHPPVPWGIGITVWHILCSKCNTLVIGTSDYD